ncbi:MAG: Diguanylate cyclase [Parcubacteria group bacterium GW2011_GWC2_45_7]|nr:MAG: Diguanylate cyclase [Parcubacteria group bacterium GW2011_GWC2_45_7]
MDTAERIRRIIEDSEFEIGSAFIKITVSIGIAVFPDDMTSANYDSSQRFLISKADSALYLAKREGRNRTYLFKDVSERLG